jgi:hypothetical protein
MAIYAFFFGLAVPTVFLIDLNIAFLPLDIPGRRVEAYALFSLKFLLLSLPFFYSGLILSIGFTNAPRRVNRIYCADLVGAGVGCGLAIPALLLLSGPSATIFVAVFAFSAAAVLFHSVGSGWGTRWSILAGVAVLMFVGLNERIELVRVSNVKSYDANYGQAHERDKVYERWHPTSRVAVHPTSVSGSPDTWFHSRTVPGVLPEVMEVTNDAGARTYIYPHMSSESALDLFRYDSSDLVYAMTSDPEVLVVGVGGGKDMISALAFDASAVTGVELNPLMIDIVQSEFGDFSGRPYADPRVRIAIAEGRHFIASQPDSYDVIKISVTDSWAASARGAYTLNENYLYTLEALGDFMDHLEPGGFLSITRWYPLETLRLASLVGQSLRDRGVEDPSDQVLMARNTGAVASTLTLIVKNGSLTDAERTLFAAAAGEAGHILVHAPGQDGVSGEQLDIQHRGLLTVRGLAQASTELPVNVTPPTDDRPFFFDLTGEGQIRDLGPSYQIQHARARDLLVGLLVISTSIAVVFVLAPVGFARDRRQRKARARPGSWLGYLLVEIPLIQRFILFLGHPTYAVTVVLFSMLVASGLGSLFAERLIRVGWLAPPVLLGVAVALILLMTRYLPSFLAAAMGLPTFTRVVLGIALIFPVAFLLGLPFPTGLRIAHARGTSLVPWAWAVNGAASVAAPALATLFAMVWGFSAALYAGAAAYAAATLLLLSFGAEATATEMSARAD